MVALIAAALLAPEGISDYFPMNPGDTWVYKEVTDKFEVRTTDKVGDPIEKDGYKLFPVITSRDDKELDRVYYRLGEGEILVAAFKEKETLLAPYPILRSPELGSKWTHKGETFMEGALTDLTLEGSVRKSGSAEFKGQKVDTLEVRLEATVMESFGTPYKVTQVATYGKGIGLLKMESTTKLPKRTVKMTRSLVEYRPKAL